MIDFIWFWLKSGFFVQDEVFDTFSGGNGRSSVVMMANAVYETGRAAGGSTAALLESLQVNILSFILIPLNFCSEATMASFHQHK